jgi:hypothetical protein
MLAVIAGGGAAGAGAAGVGLAWGGAASSAPADAASVPTEIDNTHPTIMSLKSFTGASDKKLAGM